MFDIENDEDRTSRRGSTPLPPSDEHESARQLTFGAMFLKQMRLLWYALKTINVDVIIFLVYAGWAFGNTLQAPGLYRRVCETYYENDQNCTRIIDPDIENGVQKHVAEWSVYNAIAYLTPALVVDTILGAYGDKYGRQINILFGICGIAFSEYGFLLTLSETVQAPYWITPLFGLVAGMTGYIAMVPVSCNAYLADITDNSDLLTIRAGVLSASQSLATVVGGLVAAFSNIQIGIAVDIELLLYLFAFAYTLYRIPQTPGHRGSFVGQTRSNTVMTSASSRQPEGVRQFFHELFKLLKSGIRVYTRRRVGHRRAFMVVCVVVLMITYTTSVETRISPVMNSYVFRRQEGGLDWTTHDLGLWNGTGYLILFAGTLIFLPIFKRVFLFRETTIILIALVSGAARSAIIGFSTKTWQMYVAQIAGIFSGMIQPAIVSFIVQLVPYEEVGRVFSLFGIGGDLAFIFTYLIYNNIYRVTVEWFPGFMYEFIAGLHMVVFGVMIWVHFQSKRERIGENTAITRDTTASRSRVRAISTVSRPDLQPKLSRREIINDKRQSLFAFE